MANDPQNRVSDLSESSTSFLLKLCGGYFIFYVIYAIITKYFADGSPHIGQMEYLVYSTIGGNILCLAVAIALRWYRLKSNGNVTVWGVKIPVEYFYIIPSGVCTAVVIPTTTLMYTLPISVMVAMVIMRGSIIVISRIIDAIQIYQGILKKKVYWEEEIAVIFAILAVCVLVFGKTRGGFDFIHSKPAMIILISYILAYFIRLYIMNYYKNTRAKGVPQDNKGFFAIEQIAAAVTIVTMGLILFYGVNANLSQLIQYKMAFTEPSRYWYWEVLGGMTFGMVAFFSVFLFMFKGRNATFSGLVNRLTSLVAGTTATLISYFALAGKFPKRQDWVSVAFIMIAVIFLTMAEKKRARELKS